VTSRFSKKTLRASLVALAAASALVLSACAGGGGGETPDEGDADQGLMTPGTLVVGMNLQYKPEMFLDDNGDPAGYDVDLLNALADDMGVELQIENLDFNGLIPGLQAAQFDMVSVGLGATDERKKVISFSRGYVPYATILGIPVDAERDNTIEAYNQAGVVITALQGSTSEQLGKDQFPNATITSFPDQNAALLEVASGRADAIIVEDYLMADFNKSNGDPLKAAALPEPLSLYYGSWGVQKDNQKLIDILDAFLCKSQEDGTLADLYTKWMAPEAPEFPAC
jgi:ABC-type amino acid transport substrate-binding protein